MKENALNPAALEAISKDLESLKQSREAGSAQRVAPSSSTAKASVDFLSALAVCSLIGYGIDIWVDASPWGLLIGVLVGAGIGAKLMVNTMNRTTEKQ